MTTKEFKDLKEWCESPDNVYVGRAGVVRINNKPYPPFSSEFSNIFKVGRDGDINDVLEKYEAYIRYRLSKEPRLLNELIQMKDKCLGCWCIEEINHTHILLKIINEFIDDVK